MPLSLLTSGVRDATESEGELRMDEKRKRAGRALSALRSGLRQAQADLQAAGATEAAQDCQRALRRAERFQASHSA